jgi:hypothetical protein
VEMEVALVVLPLGLGRGAAPDNLQSGRQKAVCSSSEQPERQTKGARPPYSKACRSVVKFAEFW